MGIARLQVFVFPGQAFVAGRMGEKNLVGTRFMDVPLLGGIVEADVGGAGDFQRSKYTEVDCLGVKAIDQSVIWLKTKGGFHPLPPPNRCWFRPVFVCFQ